MGQYSYTPTYYSSLHDTITSLCKSFLPFRRGRCLPNPLHKRQADHLKWQQESFHRILHLLALRREGIVPDADVAAFRTHLLDTLIAAPSDPEPPSLLRDKLIFLQELLYAGCISRADYHSSKRPLLQRLAVQGVEIDSRDLVIAGNPPAEEEEEWSEIDLRDKETVKPPGKKAERRSPLRPLRSAMALFGGRRSNAAAPAEATDPPRGSCSVLMAGSAKEEPAVASKKKKKSLHALFSKEQGTVGGWKHLEGLRRWKRGGSNKEEEAAVDMESGRRSGDVVSCELVASPVGEAPDTKRRKAATTTMLPAEEFLPIAQGSHRGGVAGNQQQRNAASEKPNGSAQKWVEFDNDDDENRHPNLLFSSAISQHKGNHPFSDGAPKIQNKNPFATSPPRNPFLDEKLNPFYPAAC